MHEGYREEHIPMLGSRHGSDVGGGRTLLRCVCMHTHANDELGHTPWDIPLLDPGLDHDRGQQCDVAAPCQICFVFAFKTERHVVTLFRCADRLGRLDRE